MSIVFVMVGCALGGALRYGCVLAGGYLLPGFPCGTLFVNIVGSFVMGVLATYFSTRYVGASPYLRLFCMVGLLGGFTTFSSFSYETLKLLAVQNFSGALLNVALNTLGGLLAGYFGILAVQML